MPEKSPLPVTAEADAKVRDRRIREDHESAKVERAEIRCATGTLADAADRRTQLAAAAKKQNALKRVSTVRSAAAAGCTTHSRRRLVWGELLLGGHSRAGTG
jgi:hypothetical protein